MDDENREQKCAEFAMRVLNLPAELLMRDARYCPTDLDTFLGALLNQLSMDPNVMPPADELMAKLLMLVYNKRRAYENAADADKRGLEEVRAESAPSRCLCVVLNVWCA